MVTYTAVLYPKPLTTSLSLIPSCLSLKPRNRGRSCSLRKRLGFWEHQTTAGRCYTFDITSTGCIPAVLDDTSDIAVSHSTYDDKLLVGHLSIEYFRFSLEFRPFTLFTDCKTLNPDKATSALNFHYPIYFGHYHVSNKGNVATDALSRISEINISPTVNFSTIATA